MVIFGPIATSDGRAPRRRRRRASSAARAAPERPTAGREQDPGDLASAVADEAQALVDGAVLAVDRHQLGARASRAAAARPGRRRSGSPCWPGPSRLPARSVATVTGSPAKPTTRVDDDVGAVDEVGEVVDDRGERQRGGHLGPPRRVADGDVARAELAWPARPATSTDDADAERDDLVAVGLGPDDVERLGADRAGRAGDGDARRLSAAALSGPGFEHAASGSRRPGSTNRKPSKRSSTPPWPLTQRAEVLHVEVALEHALGEVAERGEHGDDRRRGAAGHASSTCRCDP